jgi:hypothetical protein
MKGNNMKIRTFMKSGKFRHWFYNIQIKYLLLIACVFEVITFMTFVILISSIPPGPLDKILIIIAILLLGLPMPLILITRQEILWINGKSIKGVFPLIYGWVIIAIILITIFFVIIG